jgi:hypothetical protein
MQFTLPTAVQDKNMNKDSELQKRPVRIYRGIILH